MTPEFRSHCNGNSNINGNISGNSNGNISGNSNISGNGNVSGNGKCNICQESVARYSRADHSRCSTKPKRHSLGSRRTGRPPKLVAFLLPLIAMMMATTTTITTMIQSVWQEQRRHRLFGALAVSAFVMEAPPRGGQGRGSGSGSGSGRHNAIRHRWMCHSGQRITSAKSDVSFRNAGSLLWFSSPGTTTRASVVSSSVLSRSMSLSSFASSSTSKNNSEATPPPNERARLLNECLDRLLHHTHTAEDETKPKTETPSAHIMEAALRSLRDPSSGYDQRFGRPALRAYRSFVYPKKLPPGLLVQQSNGNGNGNDDDDDDDSNGNGNYDSQSPNQTAMGVNEDPILLEAAAQRTANQIDFLIKRQTSKRTEAIRNHDPETLAPGATNTDSGTNQNEKTLFPITLVLDNLRGSFNVGSIFRTAEACGVSEIRTCGITPHPNGSGAEKVAKSALGADLLVPSRHFATTRMALEDLKQQPKQQGSNGNISSSSSSSDSLPLPPPLVVALETTAASHLYTGYDFRPCDCRNNDGHNDNDNDKNTKQKYGGIALILGNEVTGVDVELLAHLLEPQQEQQQQQQEQEQQKQRGGLVDAIVELPTYGQKNSLNVAAVAPVILYEIIRQWEDARANEDSEEK